MKKTNIIPILFFIGPISFFILAFTLFPTVMNFWLSFTKWDGVTLPVFVGIENYRKLVVDPDFWLSFWNTIKYVVFIVPLVTFLPLFLAIILYQEFKFNNVFKSIVIAPFVPSMVVIGVLWRWMYNPFVGPIPLLRALDLLGNYGSALYAVAFVAFWQAMGFYMYMFLAGLGSISPALYEAAKIDGANSLQTFRYITLPSLKPTFAFIVTMAIIWNLQTFDPVFVVTHGGPGFATFTFVYYIFWLTFYRFEMGYASTIAVVLFALTLIISLLSLKLLGRGE